MSVEGELRPCPFCGSEDLDIEEVYVACNGCEALGPDSIHVMKSARREDVIYLWNKREG